MKAAPKTDPLSAFNKVLKHTTVKYLDRPRAYPFVKWAGGKRSLVPEIVKVLPEQFGDYWEPFLGGGAVFFALDSRIRKAHLSDVTLDLIIAYRMIHARTDAVIEALQAHKRKHNRRHYLYVRNKMHDAQDPVLLAARFIYLNKTCFNGLYRVNKHGQFNVPIGDIPTRRSVILRTYGRCQTCWPRPRSRPGHLTASNQRPATSCTVTHPMLGPSPATPVKALTPTIKRPFGIPVDSGARLGHTSSCLIAIRRVSGVCIETSPVTRSLLHVASIAMGMGAARDPNC